MRLQSIRYGIVLSLWLLSATTAGWYLPEEEEAKAIINIAVAQVGSNEMESESEEGWESHEGSFWGRRKRATGKRATYCLGPGCFEDMCEKCCTNASQPLCQDFKWKACC